MPHAVGFLGGLQDQNSLVLSGIQVDVRFLSLYCHSIICTITLNASFRYVYYHGELYFGVPLVRSVTIPGNYRENWNGIMWILF